MIKEWNYPLSTFEILSLCYFGLNRGFRVSQKFSLCFSVHFAPCPAIFKNRIVQHKVVPEYSRTIFCYSQKHRNKKVRMKGWILTNRHLWFVKRSSSAHDIWQCIKFTRIQSGSIWLAFLFWSISMHIKPLVQMVKLNCTHTTEWHLHVYQHDAYV